MTEQVVGGRFKLERLLGQGGFSAVWLAADGERGGAPVALKVLDRKFRADSRVRMRFAREVQILAELDHPNIARMLGASLDGEDSWIALEYIEGRRLDRELVGRAAEARNFELEEIAGILGDVTGALEHAHASRVIHRDLKPANIILSERNGKRTAVVLDFGVAKIMQGPEGRDSSVGRTIGSAHHIAPEQISSSTIDARTDVFALGTMLFELLTLRQPWLRGPKDEPLSLIDLESIRHPRNARPFVLERVKNGARPRASEFREGLNPAFDELILRALSIASADRQPSAQAFLEEVEAAIAGAEPPRPLPQTRGSPKWLVVSSVAALIAATLVLLHRLGVL